MNADQLVFDVKKREVGANLDGCRNVRGVLAVPEIRIWTGSRLGASWNPARGTDELSSPPLRRPVCDPNHRRK